MPELPDIEVFTYNLQQQYAGKKLQRVTVVNDKKILDSEDELNKALAGHKLEKVYRSGKELRFRFSNGEVLGMHLMLTGDLNVFNKKHDLKWVKVELCFTDGSGLALTDRMKNANVKLNPVDKEGIDALDSRLNFNYLKNLLQRRATIKNVLLDQHLIRGIGNGYSDEILWEARISPYSIAEAIPDDKIKDLVRTIRKVLKGASKKILQSHPGLITGEVKDYLKIHRSKAETSPTGYPIKIDTKGMRKTYYTDEQVLYE